MRALFFTFVALLIPHSTKADIFPGDHLRAKPGVNSWKALRDWRIVKQDLDYSCGAASLATILTEFYGMSVTEKDVVTRMALKNKSSFQQLADIAPSYGMKAGGLMLSFDDLKKLKVPVIAYVQYRGNDHFTVIRGIRGDGVVHLADSSWGNRQLTAYQFRQMWETKDKDGVSRGRILLLVPLDMNVAKIDETFFGQPQGWSLPLQTIPFSR